MSHPWGVNNWCKVCKRRESVWNTVLKENKRWNYYIAWHLDKMCLSSGSCCQLISFIQLYIWVLQNKQGCRRLSVWRLRKIFLGALSEAGPQLLSSTGQKKDTVQEQPPASNHSCNGLMPLALSAKKVLTVRLGAACLMTQSCSSV